MGESVVDGLQVKGNNELGSSSGSRGRDGHGEHAVPDSASSVPPLPNLNNPSRLYQMRDNLAAMAEESMPYSDRAIDGIRTDGRPLYDADAALERYGVAEPILCEVWNGYGHRWGVFTDHENREDASPSLRVMRLPDRKKDKYVPPAYTRAQRFLQPIKTRTLSQRLSHTSLLHSGESFLLEKDRGADIFGRIRLDEKGIVHIDAADMTILNVGANSESVILKSDLKKSHSAKKAHDASLVNQQVKRVETADLLRGVQWNKDIVGVPLDGMHLYDAKESFQRYGFMAPTLCEVSLPGGMSWRLFVQYPEEDGEPATVLRLIPFPLSQDGSIADPELGFTLHTGESAPLVNPDTQQVNSFGSITIDNDRIVHVDTNHEINLNVRANPGSFLMGDNKSQTDVRSQTSPDEVMGASVRPEASEESSLEVSTKEALLRGAHRKKSSSVRRHLGKKPDRYTGSHRRTAVRTGTREF